MQHFHSNSLIFVLVFPVPVYANTCKDKCQPILIPQITVCVCVCVCVIKKRKERGNDTCNFKECMCVFS